MGHRDIGHMCRTYNKRTVPISGYSTEDINLNLDLWGFLGPDEHICPLCDIVRVRWSIIANILFVLFLFVAN